MAGSRGRPLPEPTEADAPTPTTEEQVEHAEVSITQWEFLEVPPTSEDVLRLLAELPPVWGVDTVAFADYVQALPQKKKVLRPHPTRPDGPMVEERIEAWTLYMSVAGRLKMMERAAADNGWRVDYEPEPTTPTGAPGYISLEQRIVYREYVVVHVLKDTDQDWFDRGEEVLLGRKPGTAWVPFTGGSNAAGSNPYEKVETSARGRALAAWGFGVFPGSGVASVEEMAGARQNQQALRNQPQVAAERGPRLSRQDLIGKVMTHAEEIRQYRGQTEEEKIAQLGSYFVGALGAAGAWDAADPQTINWDAVKDGQLQVTINALTTTIRGFVSQEHGL